MTGMGRSEERENRIREILDAYREIPPENGDEFCIRCALEMAALAGSFGEVPVGAVVAKNGKILCGDCNGREETKNALYHAEMGAIGRANGILDGWRLTGCTLYVTLEPCPMCAGAVWNARLSRVVIGAKDARAGAMGSLLNLNSYPLNWKPVVETGVLEQECRKLLQAFFRKKR